MTSRSPFQLTLFYDDTTDVHICSTITCIKLDSRNLAEKHLRWSSRKPAKRQLLSSGLDEVQINIPDLPGKLWGKILTTQRNKNRMYFNGCLYCIQGKNWYKYITSWPGQCPLLKPRTSSELITSACILYLPRFWYFTTYFWIPSLSVQHLYYTFHYSKPLKLCFIGSLPQGRSGGNTEKIDINFCDCFCFLSFIFNFTTKGKFQFSFPV